jgi:hypothetical protein
MFLIAQSTEMGFQKNLILCRHDARQLYPADIWKKFLSMVNESISLVLTVKVQEPHAALSELLQLQNRPRSHAEFCQTIHLQNTKHAGTQHRHSKDRTNITNNGTNCLTLAYVILLLQASNNVNETFSPDNNTKL